MDNSDCCLALLYMHRGFFAKAMNDHPEDPLSGKYGQSVLHAHRSASSFVALVKSMWAQHRQLTERNWFVFTHVFSCAVSYDPQLVLLHIIDSD